MNPVEQERDLETLRGVARLLLRENEKLVAHVVELKREILKLQGREQGELQLRLQELEQQLATRNRMLFGKSSEKHPGAGDAASSAPKAEKPKKGHGPHKQPTLPVVVEDHDLDEADQVCPQCGGHLDAIEGQFEEADEIDVIARQFVVRRHRRVKRSCCKCHSCVETAPGPAKLFPGARYSIDFAIEVAADKYLFHMPLERQVRQMQGEGLVIESQTLWDQLNAAARLLEPAHQRMHETLMQLPVLGADETRWPVMRTKGKPESANKTWQVWTLSSPIGVYYRIQDSRSTPAAREMLGEYTGQLMVDGYSVYQSLARSGCRFTLSFCWAHVRRKFDEIRPFFPAEADEVLTYIGELYRIEDRCPAGSEHDEARRALRDVESRAVVKKIETWALGVMALPQSGLGKAIAYMAELWTGLNRFLNDPRIPLDNNGTERAQRGPVIGRKNHYGSRSMRGTEVAAILYTLLESAKLNEIDPKAYLRLALHAALRHEQVPLPHEVASEQRRSADAGASVAGATDPVVTTS